MVILDAVRKGQTLEMGCRRAGVTPRTVRAWLKASDKQEFSRAYDIAMAQAEEKLVRIVNEHAETSPATAKWLLARRYAHWRDPLDESLKQARLQKELMEVELARAKLDRIRNETTIDLMDVLETPKKLEKKDGKDEERSQRSSSQDAGETTRYRPVESVSDKREPYDEAAYASEDEDDEEDEGAHAR